MEIEILGSGTSMGVPIVGCDCSVCQSRNPRDKRLRTSIFIQSEDVHILVDTSTDYRQQMLRAGRKRLDAVLYTHHHVDHILGLDDLRSLNFMQKGPIPIYASEETMYYIRQVFAYAFNEKPAISDVPRLEPHIISDALFRVKGVEITPIPLLHGDLPILGFRIGDFAYCTDVNRILDASYEKLAHLKILVLDALRFEPHPTHFTIAQAVEEAHKIGAAITYLTHLTHDIPYEETERQLPEGIHLAYDGLKLVVD